MKKIGIIFLLCLAVCTCGCTKKGIIPKNKMAAICADMFPMDQYMSADRDMKRFTDTCAVYKPLLRSYGYTADQYLASIDYYLENSRDMAEILDKTDQILKKREAKILRRMAREAARGDSTAVVRKRRKEAVDSVAKDNAEGILK